MKHMFNIMIYMHFYCFFIFFIFLLEMVENHQEYEKTIKNIKKPIKINNGFLIIKLNNKREFKEEVDIDKQVEELAKKEMNRQLNSFSMILFNFNKS